MPRLSSGDGRSVDEETAALYNFEQESDPALALPKRQQYKQDTSDTLPLTGQASMSNSDDMEMKRKRRNMMYTFVPNWPLAGPRMDALGVLGHSKSVSPSTEAIAGLGR